jgi:hypothetical protein
MKVDLWTLNESFQALSRLANQSLPKEHFKLTFKLGRIFKAAKARIDDWGDDVNRLMANAGIRQTPDGKLWQIEESGEPKTPATADQVMAFNKAAKEVMKAEQVDLIGHYTPFEASEILAIASISSLDFGLLYGWLIVGELPEETQEETGKTAGASA